MIQADLLTQSPMLAAPCATPAQTAALLSEAGKHLFEIKFDGVRCIAIVDRGEVTLRNRRGAVITGRYPEVVVALKDRFSDSDVVLDGELVGLDPVTGRPEFSRIARRDQLSIPSKIARASVDLPATFMVFDVLYDDGVDLRQREYRYRHALLHQLIPPVDQRIVASVASTDGNLMWAFANEHQLEGLIAKEVTSRYRVGRSTAWTKLKCNKRITAIVTGYVAGEDGRAGQVGALLVSLLDDNDQLVYVGKVGTGFKEADHKPLMEVLLTGQEFLVEVEFLEFTRDKRLRMPSFKGVRSDVTRDAATMAQIGQS